MALAKKRRAKAPAAKPSSAAQKIRHALDPNPPPPTDDAVPLPARKRALVEAARPPPLKLLSQREVCALIGVSPPTLWKWTRLGKFPKARVLNGGKLGYLAHEIEAWILDQPLQTLKPVDEEARR
jgi:predicted DNA-binding transcriptional regulator AlpA